MDDQQIQQAMMQLSGDIAALKTEVKSTWKRIDEQKQLADSVHTLALSVRDLTNAQKNNTEAITALRRDVDELKAKPARRWESAVGVITTVVVTAVVTYFITAAGLN